MLDFVPARLRVLRIRRPKYGCRACGTIHQAAAPERPIAKGLASPGLLAHVLVSAGRRHRRDLAVLKTLGFVRRQIALTVTWQASALVLVALLVGLPLGVAAGRWLWTRVADGLGVVAVPVVPLAAIALVVPAAFALSTLIAAIPAAMAARTRPAIALRAE